MKESLDRRKRRDHAPQNVRARGEHHLDQVLAIMSEGDDAPEPEWRKKQKEYEIKKARAKALKLRLTCSICSKKAKLNCPCGTTQYCSTECQRIDWRDRGHRAACKKIRNDRAAEAARAEAPTPPPSTPPEVVYGPAPRSHADEVRARIAAEHEAARARREAEPEPEKPLLWQSTRFGTRCPVCFEDWDVNADPRLNEEPLLLYCCCRMVCSSCAQPIINARMPCPLCRVPYPKSHAQGLARLRRHVENEVPEAINELGISYRDGLLGLPRDSFKKAAKLFKRAVELGQADAMANLASIYSEGEEGVRQNTKKSIDLYRAAADQGHPVALYELGNHMYLRAEKFETRVEFEHAVRYYETAANLGQRNAQYSLGVCYWNGHGVERNREQAIIWMKRAAANGHEDATAVLETMNVESPAPPPS